MDIPDGYLPDYGEVYGEKNGYTYGWNQNHTDNTAVRNLDSDPLLDTVCEFHDGGKWEIELANGTYDVTVSVGDSVYESVGGSVYGSPDAYYTINVEDVNFWDNVNLESG